MTMTLKELLDQGKISKMTIVFPCDSEQQSNTIIGNFQDSQLTEGFTLKKQGADYKCKIDKKSGEIEDEVWNTSVTIVFE